MNRTEMVESLRKCESCGHIRSSHYQGGTCTAHSMQHVDGFDLADPCTCLAFVPGELSSEGKRAEVRR